MRENLHVPTCYPGIVAVPAEQFGPPAARWDSAAIPPGAVRVNSTVGARLGKPAVRWADMEKADLAKLQSFGVSNKRRLTLGGIGCSGARPMVSANTDYVRFKALGCRFFREPTPKDLELRPWGKGPREGIWDWAWQFVDELLPSFEAEKMVFESWLAGMPSRRRAALERAWKQYRRTGWRRGYRKFKAFIKTEMLPGFAKAGGDIVRMEAMVDRLIQGPHDATHCIAGPWLKPLVWRLKEIWTFDGAIFYGGCGPEPLHKFLTTRLMAANATFFWSDFSMFETTHSADSWQFMERLYRRARVTDVDFWNVMDVWRQPEGSLGNLRYKAPVMNASGRDDTSLANGILNGFATYLSVAAAYLGVPLQDLTVPMVRGLRHEIVLSVAGDDSIGRLPALTPERAKEVAQAVRYNVGCFGFVTKFAYSDRLSDAVYLGMRPYPTAKGWFWGKTIGRASYKLGWLLDRGERDPLAHITGIADMHAKCSLHVPVLSDLALKIVELRQGMKRTPVVLDPNRPWEWTLQAGVEYDDLTVEAVASAYTVKPRPGMEDTTDKTVSAADVRELIAAIRRIDRLPCVVDHWLWRHMIAVDEL